MAGGREIGKGGWVEPSKQLAGWGMGGAGAGGAENFSLMVRGGEGWR